MKKAVLIDAKSRQVRDIQVLDGLDGWYNAIGCELVTVVTQLDDWDSLIVDDEGLLKDPEQFFLWEGYDQPLAGNGLIVGCDEEGETQDCRTTAEAVRGKVKFMDAQEVMQYIIKYSTGM